MMYRPELVHVSLSQLTAQGIRDSRQTVPLPFPRIRYLTKQDRNTLKMLIYEIIFFFLKR